VDANTCAKYKCPTGYTNKENALQLPCADENCTDTPWPMCCTERAPCTDLKCPQNWLQTPANNSLCLGYACDQLVDKEVCCEEAPTCANFACPWREAHRTGHGNISCAHIPCHPTLDAGTCCESQALCSKHTCPPGLGFIDLADDTTCAYGTCTDSDTHTCCAEHESCQWFACPTGKAWKDDYMHLNCTLESCTLDDVDTCCDEAEGCANFFCPPGWTHRDDSDNLYCKEKKCIEGESSADHLMCCVPLPTTTKEADALIQQTEVSGDGDTFPLNDDTAGSPLKNPSRADHTESIEIAASGVTVNMAGSSKTSRAGDWMRAEAPSPPAAEDSHMERLISYMKR